MGKCFFSLVDDDVQPCRSKAGFNSQGFCAPVKTRVLEALDFDVCDRALSARFKSMAGRDLVHSASGLVTVSIGGCSVLWRQHWQLLRLPCGLDLIEVVIQRSQGCTSQTTLSRYMGRLCAGRSVGGPYDAAGLSLPAKCHELNPPNPAKSTPSR